MSLLVWYPLQGDTNNYGTLGAELNPTASGLAYTTGKLGQCLSRGSLTWTAEQTAKAFHRTTSIAFWLKPIQGSGSTPIVGNSGMGADTGRRKYTFYQWETWNVLHYTWQHDDSGSAFFGGTVTLDGNWHHVVGIQDEAAGTCSIYVDGVRCAHGNFDIKNMSFNYAWPTTIIHDTALNNIADFRVYDHALSTKEIKDLAKGLMVHYNFDGRPADYLHFTGTQYIDTGVSTTARWEFDMQWDKLDGTRQLMGYLGNSGQYWGVNADGYYEIYASSGVRAGERDLITHHFGEDGVYLLVIEGKGQIGAGGALDGSTYHIGALRGGSLCGFKLYRCRCISNGILIRDFVPWKEGEEYGLKDMKTGTFYRNAGTGSFGGAITNSNHLIANNAGYNNAITTSKCSASYDTGSGIHSAVCTGSWYGWGDTSTSTGASWNDAVYIRGDVGTMTPTEFTVSWWFKYHSMSYSSWINLSGDENNGGTYSGNLSTLTDYDGTWKLGGTSLISTNNILTSGWHHYAITAKNGGEAKLYRDGKLIQTSALTQALGPFSYILIGCGYAGGVVRPTRGLYGDFKLFMTELSESDIEELYHIKWASNKTAQVFSSAVHENKDRHQITHAGVINCLDIQETGIVPASYQPLQYIYSADRNRCIDTETTFNINTDKVEIDFQSADDTGNYFIAGCGTSGTASPYLWIYQYPSGSTFSVYADTGGGQKAWHSGNRQDSNRHVVTLDKKVLFYDGTGRVNNSSITFSDNLNTFCLFDSCVAGSGYSAKVKIYSCKIWHSDVLVRNLIPAQYKDGENIVRGFFDTVSGRFFGESAGRSLGGGPAAVGSSKQGQIYVGEFNET